MRAANSMADIIYSCIQIDDDSSSLLMNIRNFLVDNYTK